MNTKQRQWMIRNLKAAHVSRRRKSDLEDVKYLERLQHMSHSEREQTIVHHNQLLQGDLARGKSMLGGESKAYKAFASKRRAGLAFPLEDGRIRSSGRTYTPEEWRAEHD